MRYLNGEQDRPYGGQYDRAVQLSYRSIEVIFIISSFDKSQQDGI